MIRFHDSQKQIAPCIVSKARYFLKLKNIKPNNKKICSQNYWERTVETLSRIYIIEDSLKENARNSFSKAIAK